MLKQWYKISLILLFTLIFPIEVVKAEGEIVKDKTKSDIKFEIRTRDGICRNRSPIMIDLLFKNDSNKPQKLCVYKFYDSLLKMEIKDSKGKKLDFNPQVVTAGTVTEKDWIEIPGGRTYKRTFSLSRKVIDTIGSKLNPDNYIIRAVYEGCSKFDSSLPEEKMESNLIFLMVTE